MSELVSVGTGRGLTVLVISEEVDEHPLASVTVTETLCPLVSVLVVNAGEEPLCTLVPLILKL
jgi:hypothetical protein